MDTNKQGQTPSATAVVCGDLRLHPPPSSPPHCLHTSRRKERPSISDIGNVVHKTSTRARERERESECVHLSNLSALEAQVKKKSKVASNEDEAKSRDQESTERRPRTTSSLLHLLVAFASSNANTDGNTTLIRFEVKQHRLDKSENSAIHQNPSWSRRSICEQLRVLWHGKKRWMPCCGALAATRSDVKSPCEERWRESEANKKKRVGPGRKSNSEHAIAFYQYALERMQPKKSSSDESDDSGDDSESSSSDSSSHDDATDDSEEEGSASKKAGKEHSGRTGKAGSEHDENSNSDQRTDKPEDDVAAAVEHSNTKGRPKGSTNNDRRPNRKQRKLQVHSAHKGDESSMESMDSQEFLDQHNDVCDVCSKGGELLCCSTCTLAYHIQCVRPALTSLPTGDWSCAECIIHGIFGPYKRHSKIYKAASRAIREMKKLRAQQSAAKPKRAETTSGDSKDGGVSETVNETNQAETKIATASNEKRDTEKESSPATPSKTADDQTTKSTPQAKSDLSKDGLAGAAMAAAAAAEFGTKEKSNTTSATEKDANSISTKDKASAANADADADAESKAKADVDVNADADAAAKSMGIDPTAPAPAGSAKTDAEAKVTTAKTPTIASTSAALPVTEPTLPATPPPTTTRSGRQRKQPILFNPQTCADSEWRSDETPLKPESSNDASKGSDGDTRSGRKARKQNADAPGPSTKAKEGTRAEGEQSDPDVVVWCNFCKDDSAVMICCFCACRVCFGKHAKSKLLLCDQCDAEYHTFCLDPPLKTVPTDKWFCPTCDEHKKQIDNVERESRRRTPTKASGDKDACSRSRSDLRMPKSRTKQQPAQLSPKASASRATKAQTPRSSPSRPKTPSPAKSTGKTGTGRPRGRPPKQKVQQEANQPSISAALAAALSAPIPRKRGRPPKNAPSSTAKPAAASRSLSPPARKRGRSPKNSPKAANVAMQKQSDSKSSIHDNSHRTASGNKRTLSYANDHEECPAQRKPKTTGDANPSPDKAQARAIGTEHKTGSSSESAVSGRSFASSPKPSVVDKPILQSRSGRIVKRTSFHDEIEEGDQLLRSDKNKSSDKSKEAAKRPSPTRQRQAKRQKQEQGQTESLKSSVHASTKSADTPKSAAQTTGTRDDLSCASTDTIVSTEAAVNAHTKIALQPPPATAAQTKSADSKLKPPATETRKANSSAPVKTAALVDLKTPKTANTRPTVSNVSIASNDIQQNVGGLQNPAPSISQPALDTNIASKQSQQRMRATATTNNDTGTSIGAVSVSVHSAEVVRSGQPAPAAPVKATPAATMLSAHGSTSTSKTVPTPNPMPSFSESINSTQQPKIPQQPHTEVPKTATSTAPKPAIASEPIKAVAAPIVQAVPAKTAPVPSGSPATPTKAVAPIPATAASMPTMKAQASSAASVTKKDGGMRKASPTMPPAAATAAPEVPKTPAGGTVSPTIVPSMSTPRTPASDNPAMPTSTKVPRRKPGARECMQISRRFGNRVIPKRYMETLLDYCNRGKVEHLIRMRERLDDHARYLEAQLAGLEAVVREKGESDVVVPALPESSERSRSNDLP